MPSGPDRFDFAAREDDVAREMAAASAGFWQSATRRLAREINIGWWFSRLMPMVVTIGLVGMFTMLLVRWRGGSVFGVFLGIAIALGTAAIVAWWRGRSQFESVASARVRLEEALALKTRLTAASAGVGSWPTRPDDAAFVWPVRWRWQQPLGWVAAITVLLMLAARVPVADPGAPKTYTIEKPPDARVVEQWMDALRREEAVDERSVERVRDRIAELMERPTEDWYEHASLEAAGTLKEQTAAELTELMENLAKAEAAAAQLREMTEAIPQDVRDALAKDLKLAALALEMGGFKPPADLAELLRELQGRDLAELTPGECEGLCEKLGANRELLLRALAKSPELDLDALAMLAVPGEGGIDRGRADAELKLGEEHDLKTSRKEKVNQALDIERAAPDELLAVVDGEHDIDETAYTGPAAGGTAKEGDGGTSVEVDSLLPAEQKVVRRFFE
jgi:hypothetical protein